MSDATHDGTCGYTKEQLLEVRGDIPVPGYEEFWREQYRRATECKLDYTVEGKVWSPAPGTTVYKVSFTACDGFRIGMWICRPDVSRGGMIIAHGYGNPATPAISENPGLTTAMPCVPGLGLSQCEEIPWQSGQHAAYGFDDPEKYVLIAGVRNLWTAVSIMIDMFPDVKDNIVCSGGSLGGAMGALCTAWDHRIKAVELNVPTLGGRIMLQYPGSEGDPSHTRATMAKSSETGMRVFDLCSASAAASFIRVPALLTPALCDTNVPPPGQFAVANSVPEEYRILRIREVGHHAPTEADRLMEENELKAIRKKIFNLGE